MATEEGLKAAEELAKKLAELRLAHESMMLQDAREVLRQAREGVNAHSLAMGIPLTASPTATSGGIHIGDVIQQAPASPVPQSTAQPAAQSPVAATEAKPTSTLATLGLAAALVAGGIGGGAGGAALLDSLKPNAPATSPAPATIEYDLRLVTEPVSNNTGASSPEATGSPGPSP